MVTVPTQLMVITSVYVKSSIFYVQLKFHDFKSNVIQVLTTYTEYVRRFFPELILDIFGGRRNTLLAE